MSRLDSPPAPGEYEPTTRPVRLEDSARGEVARDSLRAYSSQSAVAELTADIRNMTALQGDVRLVRLCRAYFLGSEAQREQLASLAEQVISSVREVS